MQTISAAQLRALGNHVTILDVGRRQGPTEIGGALRYSPDELLNAKHLVLPLPTHLPVVIYGSGNGELRMTAIAARLEDELGLSVSILEGGVEAWRAVAGPEQEASLEQPVPH